MEVCCAHSRSWLNPYWLNVGIKSVLQVWYMLSTNSTLIKFYNFTCKKCSSANKAQLDLISPSCLQDWESYQKVIFSDMQVVVRLKVLGRMASSSAFFLVSVCLPQIHSLCIHSLGFSCISLKGSCFGWYHRLFLQPGALKGKERKKKKSREHRTVDFSEAAAYLLM